MFNLKHGRLQEEVGLASFLAVPSTIILIFHFLALSQIPNLVLKLGSPIAWLALILTLLGSVKNKCLILLAILLALVYYFFEYFALSQAYTVVTEQIFTEQVLYIEHAANYLISNTLMFLLAFYIGATSLFSLCIFLLPNVTVQWRTLFTFQLIIAFVLIIGSVSLALIAQLNSFQMTIMVVIPLVITLLTQIYGICRYKMLRYTLQGFLDLFKWNVLSTNDSIILIILTIGATLSQIYIFYVLYDTRLRGTDVSKELKQNEDYLLSFAFVYLAVVLHSLAALFGFGISRAIRKFTKKQGYIKLQDSESRLQSQVSMSVDNFIRTERMNFDPKNQLNPKCPICFVDFKEEDMVGVHERCEFGVHWVCLEQWIGEQNNKNCTICHNRIKKN